MGKEGGIFGDFVLQSGMYAFMYWSYTCLYGFDAPRPDDGARSGPSFSSLGTSTLYNATTLSSKPRGTVIILYWFRGEYGREAET